jgi:hypothetical protein
MHTGVPVVGPLPDVANGVVEAVGVGLVGVDWGSEDVAVLCRVLGAAASKVQPRLAWEMEGGGGQKIQIDTHGAGRYL